MPYEKVWAASLSGDGPRCESVPALLLNQRGSIEVKTEIQRVVSLQSRRAPRTLVHRKKIISAQILPFRLRGKNESRPMFIGDAATLPPLLDGLVLLPNVGGESSSVIIPPVEDRFQSKGLHVPYSEGDNYSRQGRRMFPVTALSRARTMCPMGRGTTPTRFKSQMAELLRAARISGGYATQLEFANALGVPVERYKKWESGRTPIPHQYIPDVCELLDKDANYFFRVTPKVYKKTA
jgi:hypothetical protein